MKERPILFNTDMVKAILDGRKTQSRRPVKIQPSNGWAFEDAKRGGAFGRITSPHPRKGKFGAFIRRGIGSDFPEVDIVVCPFGMKGDRLWVRETFQGPLFDADLIDDFSENPEKYKTPEFCNYKASNPLEEFMTLDDELVARWTPSIHMPRWACRLVLEITEIRLERLMDITEKDAAAEGTITGEMAAKDGLSWRFSDRTQFRDMWIKIYPNSWERNEWVWVIEFKVAELNGKKQEQAA